MDLWKAILTLIGSSALIILDIFLIIDYVMKH